MPTAGSRGYRGPWLLAFLVNVSSMPVISRAKYRSSDLHWLFSTMRGLPRDMVLLWVSTVAASLMAAVDPLIVKWLLDDLLQAHRTSLVILASVLFLLCYCVRILLEQFAELKTVEATQAMATSLRFGILKAVVRLPGSYHDSVPVGETLFHVNDDVRQVSETSTEIVSEMTRMIVVGIAAVTTMFCINSTITLLLIPFLALFAWIKHRAGIVFKRHCDIVQLTTAKASVFSQEIVSAAPEIQMLQCERPLLKRFVEHSRKVASAWIARKRSLCRVNFAAMAIVVLAMSIVLGYGGYLVENQKITVGSLIALYSYVIRICEPLTLVVDLDSRLARFNTSLTDIHRIVAAAGPTGRATSLRDAEQNDAVSFDRVTFAYRAREMTLRKITFRIARGERVVIIGKTGSGKSTLFKLMLQVYPGYVGRIHCNGVDISKSPLSLVRSEFSVVPQHVVLFEGSLRQNLLLANNRASSDVLDEAIAASQLSSLVERLALGLDETVGAQGTQLSGGEKQRIAFARALLKNAPIFLFDEFTSALDLETESHLLKSLSVAARDRTVLAISHKPAVIEWADRVLIFDHGELIADTTPRSALVREVISRTSPSTLLGITG